MSGRSHLVYPLTACAMAVFALSACGSDDTYQAPPPPVKDREASTSGSSVLAPGSLFGSSKGTAVEGAVAVNAFLWRASLDTVAFMPLSSADPFGGVIISDWYAPPETPDERFKVNVYILGRTLRADGLKISVFRQTRDAAGRWSDAAVGPEVATEFENAVLTRARDLRLRATAETN